jgi:hypothetical protein
VAAFPASERATIVASSPCGCACRQPQAFTLLKLCDDLEQIAGLRVEARDFVCVYRGQRGVVVDVDPRGAAYQRVILSSSDPDGVRRSLGM